MDKMSNFLAGPTARLVGAGMQAMGVGIPVGETSAMLLNGMRDFGVPVPPETWFKCREGKSPKPQNVYDKLEEHVRGVMQVVRPVMELKQMVQEASRSADRPRRARSPSPSGARLTYYTPQVGRQRKSSGSPVKNSRAKLLSRRKISSSTDDDETDVAAAAVVVSAKSCMYCSRSKSLLELPCGRQICSKCDMNEDLVHELECKQCEKLTD